MANTVLYQDGMAVLEKSDNERYTLTVLCGGIGMYEVRVELTPEEIVEYEEWGKHFVEHMARRICRDPEKYLHRHY